jgi:hypothetical protein|tara:strand:+ start:3285 stop:3602 length:318 start_codon:yes stop_codon:yes gene_type:complete
MAKRRLKLPEDVIRHWPEVFRGIEVKSIPLEYLQHINVSFSNGKKWQIDCKPNINQSRFDKDIRALFDEYGPQIINVDFAIDSAKLKADVQKGTGKLLKKHKFRK